MVVIRLTRVGTKNRPRYQVVVADSRMPRDGRYIENVGTYDPSPKDAKVALKIDRVQHWIGLGAQPSDTVRSLIKKASAQVTVAA